MNVLLLLGPPGTGKMRYARQLHESLPKPSAKESRQIRANLEASGLVDVYHREGRRLNQRPFRAPHHTCSAIAVIGNAKRMGEFSLAHAGTLLLDELPEFSRSTIEVIVNALRLGRCIVSGGAAGPKTWESKPTLVIATANLCPCGPGWNYISKAPAKCECKPSSVERYRDRLTFFKEELTPIEMTEPTYSAALKELAPDDPTDLLRQ